MGHGGSIPRMITSTARGTGMKYPKICQCHLKSRKGISMENIQIHYPEDYIRGAEHDHIENLILGGATPEEITAMFPKYKKADVEKMLEHIARLYWFDEEEWVKLQNRGKGEYLNDIKTVDIIMYTVKEIRQIFKCSQTQAYGLVNASGFPSIKVGGKILVEKMALEKWLDKNRGKRILL
jgi:hypothetical protein